MRDAQLLRECDDRNPKDVRWMYEAQIEALQRRVKELEEKLACKKEAA